MALESVENYSGSKNHTFVLYREQLNILLVNIRVNDAHHQRYYIGKLGKIRSLEAAVICYLVWRTSL
jgi:hypothetical protein